LRFRLETAVSIEVMGVFEFARGKITSHRDYFDMKKFNDQMADYVPVSGA